MKKIYFISDAHLSFTECEIEVEKRTKLLEFLEHIRDENKAGTELYILGDLFDFWFEWYHVIPKYWFPILYAFRKCIEAGIKIHFVSGNHDFYPGKYLEKEIGIRCFDESHEFEVKGKRFFVAHGDGYARKDRGYRFLKRVIRNPLSIFLYKTFLSADLGMQVAGMFSKSSRKVVKIEKKSWSEEYYKFAQNKFAEGFDFVILGHIHYPIVKEDNGRIYVNCGDWITEFTYALYEGDSHSLTLNRWDKGETSVHSYRHEKK
ncbi:MAG: UDP-2,3-diacylglucosamine diphosphatase [bacterium]|nr:UDP-2,3-diacylglucosamine diphosphatase [bacterium]